MISRSCLGIIFSDSYSNAMPELTSLRTMGSVPFGGRYRFIDFSLSNLVNAGISKVGVITKSNYRSLMDHLGTGRPWDLSRKNDGLFFLPPFNSTLGTYNGKLEALILVSDFINMSKEEYVIILDSNIIGNIDFSEIIDYHREKGADITHAYLEGNYPEGDIPHFEINGDGRITKITMPGIVYEGSGKYGVSITCMKRTFLQRILNTAKSENYTDFNRDILLKDVDKFKIYGYKINNFCTVIDSMGKFYDSSMDLLSSDKRKSLFDSDRPIYTKIYDDMPSTYGINSSVTNSLIADGCKIEGEVKNSILFRGVRVAKGAKVTNSIIMHGSYISEGSSANAVIMDKYSVILPHKNISGDKTFPIYIGKKLVV